MQWVRVAHLGEDQADHLCRVESSLPPFLPGKGAGGIGPHFVWGCFVGGNVRAKRRTSPALLAATCIFGRRESASPEGFRGN